MSDTQGESRTVGRSVGVSYGVSRTVGETSRYAENVGIHPAALPDYIRGKSTPKLKERARKLRDATSPDEREQAEALLLAEIEIALRFCPEWVLGRFLSDEQDSKTSAPRRAKRGDGLAPLRVVLDTNVLIGGAWRWGSASRRIMEACKTGTLRPIASPAILSEYRQIVGKAIRNAKGRADAETIMTRAETVEPVVVERVVADRDDDKIVAAAVAAQADAIITNDHALLAVSTYKGVRIVRPGEFVRLWLQGEGFTDGAGI